MSYYLTDPYYYLPKCYPFLSDKMAYPERVYSKRATSLGRHIESGSAIRRLEVANKFYEENGKCQHKVLRSTYLNAGVDNAEDLSAVVAYRRNREGSLRRTAHRFPSFVESRELIQEITRKSLHAQPI